MAVEPCSYIQQFTKILLIILKIKEHCSYYSNSITFLLYEMCPVYVLVRAIQSIRYIISYITNEVGTTTQYSFYTSVRIISTDLF